MRRRELEKRIAEIAKKSGESVQYSEGGSHTKVRIGSRYSTIPRHREIAEYTARSILRDLEEE